MDSVSCSGWFGCRQHHSMTMFVTEVSVQHNNKVPPPLRHSLTFFPSYFILLFSLEIRSHYRCFAEVERSSMYYIYHYSFYFLIINVLPSIIDIIPKTE